MSLLVQWHLVGAHIHVDDFAFIGQDALLVSGKVGNVGANSLVGAGAVATKEIPSDVVVVGSHARVIRHFLNKYNWLIYENSIIV